MKDTIKVEFYAPRCIWCGYVADEYNKVADKLADIGEVLQFGAINCLLVMNRYICEANGYSLDNSHPNHTYLTESEMATVDCAFEEYEQYCSQNSAPKAIFKYYSQNSVSFNDSWVLDTGYFTSERNLIKAIQELLETEYGNETKWLQSFTINDIIVKKDLIPDNRTLSEKWNLVWETDLLAAAQEIIDLRLSLNHREYVYFGEPVARLKEWIRVLTKYWPTSNETRDTLIQLGFDLPQEPRTLDRSGRLRVFLAQFRDWLNEHNDSEPLRQLDIRILTGRLTRAQRPLFPEAKYGGLPPNRWVTCSGSIPGIGRRDEWRGFACGAWTLFHVLSVEAYLQNMGNETWDYMEIPLAVHGYALSWYDHQQCDSCVDEFTFVTGNHGLFPMKQCIENTEDSVLYLWKIHHYFNSLLSQQLLAPRDPEIPKVPWPPRSLCPNCNAPANFSVQQAPCTVEPEWNETALLQFLIQHYSHIEPHAEEYMYWD